MLLNFPTEIVQLVLLHSATPDFLHAAIACRSLFAIASSTRELLLHHLAITPGPPVDESQTTPELFRTLARRGVANLYGVECRATVAALNYQETNINNKDQGSIDPAACAVSPRGDGNIAIASNRCQPVRLYRSVARGHLDPIFSLNLPFGLDGCVRARRVAFAKDPYDTVAVLQQVERAPPDAARLASTEPELAPFLFPGRPYIVLFHFHHSKTDGGLMAWTFAELPLVDETHLDDNEPVAFDIAADVDVAVVWRNHRTRTYRILLYELADIHADTVCVAKYTAFHEHKPPRNLKIPLVDVRFNDRGSQMLYRTAGRLFYSHFQIITGPNASTNTPSSNVDQVLLPPFLPFDSSSFTAGPMSGDGGGGSGQTRRFFAINIPFFCTHHSYTPANGGVNMCRWQYLALGSCAPHPSTESGTAPFGALLRAEAHCQSWHCGHRPNLDRGRRLRDWTVVARLRDLHPEAAVQTSLATTTAASERGTRVAVAVGTTIRVWALEPAELIASNQNGYYPPETLLRPPDADTSAPAPASTSPPPNPTDTTDGGNGDGDNGPPPIVDLAPITLHANAEVSALTFVSGYEDQLIAITAKGVEVWHFRPRTPGLRCDMVLMDVPAAESFEPEDLMSARKKRKTNDDDDDDDDEEDDEDEEEEDEEDEDEDEEEEDDEDEEENEGDTADPAAQTA